MRCFFFLFPVGRLYSYTDSHSTIECISFLLHHPKAAAGQHGAQRSTIKTWCSLVLHPHRNEWAPLNLAWVVSGLEITLRCQTWTWVREAFLVDPLAYDIFTPNGHRCALWSGIDEPQIREDAFSKRLNTSSVKSLRWNVRNCLIPRQTIVPSVLAKSWAGDTFMLESRILCLEES